MFQQPFSKRMSCNRSSFRKKRIVLNNTHTQHQFQAKLLKLITEASGNIEDRFESWPVCVCWLEGCKWFYVCIACSFRTRDTSKNKKCHHYHIHLDLYMYWHRVYNKDNCDSRVNRTAGGLLVETWIKKRIFNWNCRKSPTHVVEKLRRKSFVYSALKREKKRRESRGK